MPRPMVDGWLHVSDLCEYIRKPELEAWKARVGLREAGAISKRAIKLGTALHEYAESCIAGLPHKVDKKVNGLAEACAALSSWVILNKPEPMHIEKRLQDDLNRLVGTPDLVAKLYQKVKVIDWKSSARIRPDYIVQVNMYLAMVNEAYHLKAMPTGLIVRCDPLTALFDEYEFEFDAGLYEATLGLARFIREWRRLNGSDDAADAEDGAEQEVGEAEVSSAGTVGDRKE